jgi:ATP-dependent exoDNAse (exonuclease V) beta subunit
MNSVTKLIKKYTPEFDLEGLSLKVAIRENRPQQEVKDEWEKKGKDACEAGNKVHSLMEDFFNSIKTNSIIELKQNLIAVNTLQYLSKYIANSNLFYSEKRIYETRINLNGMPDIVFINDDKVSIIDYKTNNKISDTNKFENLLYPLEHLEHTTQNIYALQLSMYAYMYELRGFKVGDLVILHLDKETALIKAIPVLYLKQEVLSILNNEKSCQVQNQNHIKTTGYN